jgi:hypothetical protein
VSNALLTALALELAALLAGLGGVLLVNRVWRARRARQVSPSAARLDVAARGFLVDGAIAPVVAELRRVPPGVAVDRVLRMNRQRLADGARQALGAALRDERWVRRALRGARDPRWWRRLQAAHLLGVVGCPADTARVARLLGDRNVAVRAAATAALPLLDGAALAPRIVRELPAQPEGLRRRQAEALRGCWQHAEPALLACLAEAGAAAPALVAWLRLAAVLGTPAALRAALPLHGHADARVRAAAAHVLAHCFDPAALAALAALLDDADAGVRAAAAHAAAAFGPAARRLVPALAGRLADPAWDVRFRAALTLAQLGEPGRRALREARTAPDRAVSELAVMVGGLSDGAVREMAIA